MAVEFFIPKMTEHMETARIVRWLVKEGDRVSKGQVVLEVETEKAISEVEAPAEGYIKGIREGLIEGFEVKVGETIAFIVKEGEHIPSLSPLKKEKVATKADSVSIQSETDQTISTTNQIRATPSARRLSKEAGIDLNLISGSGEAGRIREEDVQQFLAHKTEISKGDWIELTPTQLLTAHRMMESVRNIPQFSAAVDIDLFNFMNFKENCFYKDLDGERKTPSVTALLIHHLAIVLKNFPLCNSSFFEDRIKLSNQINIGVAIGTDSGLFVPIIKDADNKSIDVIALELNVFQNKALNQNFSEADLSDGTFTISNLGMFGLDRFTAIINPPQSAIMAVGCIKNQLVDITDNNLIKHPFASFILTADHRVMDGLYAAKFLSALKENLEQRQPY